MQSNVHDYRSCHKASSQSLFIRTKGLSPSYWPLFRQLIILINSKAVVEGEKKWMEPVGMAGGQIKDFVRVTLARATPPHAQGRLMKP